MISHTDACVPLINRFNRPPRLWPPPCASDGFHDCVDYAAQRDPIGHGIHVALGCIYLFCAGLATSTESIAFVLFVGYALLRLPNTWRSLVPLVAAPVVWAVLALLAWTTASGLWATDGAGWRDAIGGFRGALLVPALYPIRGAWRPLLGSLIAGMTLQSAVQIGQQLNLVTNRASRTDVRFAGFHSNPVHVSLFEAVALTIAIGWMPVARSLGSRITLAFCVLLLCAGIAITAGRAAILGLLVALPMMAAALMLFHRLAWRHVALATVIGVVGFSAVGVAVVAAGGKGLTRQAGDLTATDDVRTSTGSRVLWWRAAIDAAIAHPVIGVGAGGSRHVFDHDTHVLAAIDAHPELPRETFVVAHPHSMYLQTAAELGAVGLLCLAAVGVAAGRAAWQSARESPVRAAVAVSLVLWAVAASFEALHMSGRTACLAGVLLAFASVPWRHRAESPRMAIR